MPMTAILRVLVEEGIAIPESKGTGMSQMSGYRIVPDCHYAT